MNRRGPKLLQCRVGSRRFLLFVLCAFLGGNLAAQPVAEPCSPGEITQRLEQLLQRRLDEFLEKSPTTSGLLIHVEAPRFCLSWSGAAGVDVAGSGQSLDPNQTFRIASNTKTYTAATIMRLIEGGKLDLAATLDELLPEHQLEMLRGGGYSVEKMTLKHVLTHTSGLFDHAATREYMRDVFGNPHRQWARDDQIRYSAEYGTPLGAPGETFSYSDTGYVILGGLIEKTTGKSMALAFRELLRFKELGLGATWLETFEERPPAAGRRTHQYLEEADTYDWNPSLDLYGGGGLVTSARDLALFVRHLLQGRVYAKPETLEAMLGAEIAPNQRGYRIGIERITVAGKHGWGHTGFWNTFAYHFPAEDISVAGSINQQQGGSGRGLGAELFSLVMSQEPK